MKTSPPTPATVDAYIATFAPPVQAQLQQLRATIRRAVPEAQESISYRIAAYLQHGPLLYFAAFKAHIGVYPLTHGVRAQFAKELAAFDTAKGTVRFALDRPLPWDLIERIAKFRLAENKAAAQAKAAAKAQSKAQAKPAAAKPRRVVRQTLTITSKPP